MKRGESSEKRRFQEFYEMPGAKCSIFGCGTSRKHTGVGIFRIPTGEDDLSKKTRDAWLCVVTKDREVDKNLRRQMENRTLYVYEKHFETIH